MRIVHRLVFRNKNEVKTALENAGVRNYSASSCFIVVYKVADKEKTGKLNVPVLMENLVLDDASKVYSNEEINRAQWLQVYPLWQQYNVEARSSIDYPCHSCWAHGVQHSDIIFPSTITRVKKPLLKPHNLSELFVFSEAKEVLEQGPFPLQFRPVRYLRTRPHTQELFQMMPMGTLPLAIVNPDSDYVEKGTCSECGTEYRIFRGEATIKMDYNALRGVPSGYYHTAEYMGLRALGRGLIMSGDFYHHLKKVIGQNLRLIDIIELV